jgi:parallel beta-helix repeat protein
MITNNVVRNCYFYDNALGMQLADADSVGAPNYVYNNVFVGNSWGVYLCYGASHFRVFNNTFYNNTGGAIDNEIHSGSDNWIVNNLCYQNDQVGMRCVGGAGSSFWTNNVSVSNPLNFFNSSSAAALSGNLLNNTLDPQLVDPANGDFRIRAGSAVRNSGINLSAYFATDRAGAARPTSGPWDIGAYAYASGGVPNSPPSISSISGQTTSVSVPTPAIPFTVNDAETPANNLTVSGSSSDPTLVPNSNILFVGAGTSRTVTITPAAALTGTTTIAITVGDGTNSTATSFQLTVTPPTSANTAPVVSAGTDQSITLPAVASLNGTVTDDGLPNPPGVVNVSWSAVSGPGTVTFGNANARQTTASFSFSGTYTLRLTATDGALVSQDDLVVTVLPVNPTPGAVTIPIEAESGGLSIPMSIFSEAGGTQYIGSSTPDQGTAFYSFSVPTAGDYVIWCRVLAAADWSDSFYASVDGGAEIPYIASEGTPSPSWEWTRVNQRIPGPTFAVSPRVFSFSQGTHTLMIRCREADTFLDRLLITNDPNLVPVDQGPVMIPIEAEAGALTNPMGIFTETSLAAGTRYIGSPTPDQGTATFSFSVPTAGDYVIWCRVLAAADVSDSFYASVDGGTEIPYRASEGTPSPSWKWTRVNQRIPGPTFAVSPRVFSFSQGTHTLVIRGREANTFLDRLVVTNDPDLVPSDATAQGSPRILSMDVNQSGAFLTWESIPGRIYQIAYKNNLNDPQWSVVPQNLTASGTTLYWVDVDSASSPVRFYRVLLTP